MTGGVQRVRNSGDSVFGLACDFRRLSMGRTKRRSFILLCGIGVLIGEFAKGSAPSRSLEVLHAFTAAGGESMGNLVRAADGTLYGTSRADGISLGTVFALTPDGMGGFTHRTLHAFNGAEGIYPEA